MIRDPSEGRTDSDKLVSRLSKSELTTIGSQDDAVSVARIETPKGARLELSRPDAARQKRLDAVALECLTWQDQATFERLEQNHGSGGSKAPIIASASELVGSEDVVDIDGSGQEPIVEERELTNITNEFAHATISEVEIGEQILLQIAAPKINLRIVLNEAALSSIIQLPMDVFDQLIRDKIE